MADLIQLRRDLAATWTAENPTLAQGEIGLELDTGLEKRGDGTTAWNSLAYHDTLPKTQSLTEIGAALVDSDEIPVYDASATANRKSLLSRIWTYISGKLTATANVFTAAQTISVTDNTNPPLLVRQFGNSNALVVDGIQDPLVGKRYGNDANGPFIFLMKNRSADGSAMTTVNSQDSLGGIIAMGADGTNWVSSVQISFAVDGDPGANDMPGRIVFSTTADGASGPTERMRINSSGNVLIATGTDNSSGAKLQVNGAITAGDGSASLPSYSNSDDPNTGVYFPAADSVAIATGGTERVRVDSAGNVGVGGAPSASQSLLLNKVITGATAAFGTYSTGQIQSDVTTAARYFATNASSQAASFTLANLHHFYASQGTFGANSAVTNQVGFLAEVNLTGATNNYGFYGNIAAAAGCWNFYAAGTAQNYFGGNVILKLASSVTPANNGELMIEATSDTSLTFKYKGSDGVVRSASLTLA